MDHFSVPMLAESGTYATATGAALAAVSTSSSTINLSNNHHSGATHLHHKDHMLAAGNSPATPFINYNTLDGNSSSGKDDNNSTTTTITAPTTANLLKSDFAEFTNCIQQSALLDHRNVVEPSMDSLSGLCDLKFPSPNPHSGSSGGSGGSVGVGVGVVASDTNFRHHLTLMSSMEAKTMSTHSEHNNSSINSHHQQQQPQQQHNVEPVPSFTNLLFNTRADTMSIDPKLITQTTQHVGGNLGSGDGNMTTTATTSYHTLKTPVKGERLAPTMLQQQQQQQQHNVAATNSNSVSIIGDVATATNNHVGGVVTCESFNIASTTITKVNNNNINNNSNNITNHNLINNSKLNNATCYTTTTAESTTTTTTTPQQQHHQQQQHKQSSNQVDSNTKLADSQITTTSLTTTAVNHQHQHHRNNSNNNNHHDSNNQMNNTRSALHNIEELAASSCTSSSRVALVANQHHNHQQQPQQQQQQQQHHQHHQQQHQQQQQHNHVSAHHANNSNNNMAAKQVLNIEPHKNSTSTTTLTTKTQHLSSPSTGSEDSMSSEDDLIIDEHSGYQDTTSSHSQQSGGGGGGSGGGSAAGGNSGLNSASLLNGGGNGGSGNAAGGYMSLLPPSASSSGSHLGGVVGGGGNGGAGIAGGGPGGTSATAGVGGESIDFKHLFEELCPVCGDKVSGYHYGLLTCESCKGFFKRTVQNKKVYTCVAERSCHIDKTQRKRCPYCRFQKCLEVGMKLEAVRADRMRGGRNKFGPMYKRDRARKLQVMRQRQLALQALRTSMGTTDMKSTPLSPGYQQAYPNMNIKQEIQIPQVSSLTQSPDSSPSPIAIALGQVNVSSGGVIATPMNGNNGSAGGGNGAGGGSGNGGGNGGSNNSGDIINRGSNSCHDAGTGSLQNTAESKLCFDSGTHPSSTADSLIEPLRVSPMIREFVQSIDDREWQTQLFALLQKQTYNQVEVDLFELMCKVLDQNLFSQVDWARNTVFFKDLKVDDQMKLLQHSWSDMLVLDHLHHRIHNGLPDETQLNNGQVFDLLSLGLLGVPQLGDFFNELQNKLQDLKFDMGDYVCMKFLILLNPDVRGIINKKTVLEGHENVQAALLDYTLTCYPSVTDKFRRLLNILPDIHAMAARGEEHLYTKHCAGSAPTQTLLMEMLHAKRKV